MTDLRPYQINDIARIDTALDAAIKALYVLPTGGGKTVVAAKYRSAICGSRSSHFDPDAPARNPEANVAQDVARSRTDSSRAEYRSAYPVQVASVQTLGALHAHQQVPLPAANLIIVDEAHHVAATTWRN